MKTGYLESKNFPEQNAFIVCGRGVFVALIQGWTFKHEKAYSGLE